ncbi:MAG: c-type cytochrome [Candidatus Marinimicrobia bacterium]|nr:c-type cytochrome [Candidatus Neomarinimicrobiota bacterium]MBT3762329.1 c-type cytochrome [Candidatus Neomarinimicrobiota bacterium]MBT4067853.1 c-type cytochrome [Candidatus Neomarinimicrobiota bacterium]MBT4809679.1 c-type cytochrome [Candidatus Neomarinimicrobiota bacterium]MBT5176173.1 c-type cytochrome [Candidatus Neomarinimicrobiota bacterium]
MANELGCGNCHGGASASSIIKNRAPDLSYAGLKYNEAFLFDYLKSPKSIRKNIGKSRMPDFEFSDDEALALTKYLMTRKNLPHGRTLSQSRIRNNDNGFNLIHNELQCTACHTLNGEGEEKSTDLTEAGVRLQPNWLYDLILNPSSYVPRESPMPSFFNKEDPTVLKTIKTIVGYLGNIGEIRGKTLNQKLNTAIKENASVTSRMGRDIFLSQNCQACHDMTGENNWFENHNAPDLTHQRMKTPSGWLLQYLKNPSPIRPNGYFPGTGSRMPNYNLSELEVEVLGDWLGGAISKTKLLKISDFQSDKVERLLNDFLPCLGCHTLNGNGGKIGPDLSNVGNRLTDGFIKMAIQMPHMVMPESIMPKTAMDPKMIPLIQSYFAQSASNKRVQYLNLIQNRPYPIENKYIANCASCHGSKGDGAGFNAAYLPIKPGDFTNGKLIGQKADDTLYDTIHVGGRIMNKSNFMPGWGEKLSQKEIVGYVQTIRDFCDCEQPGWAKK